MSNIVEETAASLDALAINILQVMTDDRTFAEIWGWNQPAINRTELARLPQDLAQKIRLLDEKSLSAELKAFLPIVQTRTQWIQANTVPQIPGGNSFMGVDAIKHFCELVESKLPPPPPQIVEVDWRAVESRKLLPADLLRRLRAVEASLKNVEPRIASAAEDMSLIIKARAAAEDLPVSLQDLEEMQTQLSSARAEAEGAMKDIAENRRLTGALLAQMEIDQTEARGVLANLGTAYRAATTKGLATAFSWKALILNSTVVLWIVLLGAALSAGGMIAHWRFTDMQTLVTNPNIPTERLWVQAILAILGVGGPIWFAWVATKQIGQRFRMAEDYAFKATVAKAYEGFRLEALRVDPALEARLFANAIGRFEEAPLRLVEPASHGSPLHELMQKPVFAQAVRAFPQLGSAASSLLAAAGGYLTSSAANESGSDDAEISSAGNKRGRNAKKSTAVETEEREEG